MGEMLKETGVGDMHQWSSNVYDYVVDHIIQHRLLLECLSAACSCMQDGEVVADVKSMHAAACCMQTEPPETAACYSAAVHH
jgi:hypothetical protein